MLGGEVREAQEGEESHPTLTKALAHFREGGGSTWSVGRSSLVLSLEPRALDGDSPGPVSWAYLPFQGASWPLTMKKDKRQKQRKSCAVSLPSASPGQAHLPVALVLFYDCDPNIFFPEVDPRPWLWEGGA